MQPRVGRRAQCLAAAAPSGQVQCSRSRANSASWVRTEPAGRSSTSAKPQPHATSTTSCSGRTRILMLTSPAPRPDPSGGRLAAARRARDGPCRPPTSRPAAAGPCPAGTGCAARRSPWSPPVRPRRGRPTRRRSAGTSSRRLRPRGERSRRSAAPCRHDPARRGGRRAAAQRSLLRVAGLARAVRACAGAGAFVAAQVVGAAGVLVAGPLAHAAPARVEAGGAVGHAARLGAPGTRAAGQGGVGSAR